MVSRSPLANQICEGMLLLGLHEAPEFYVDNPMDRSADLRPGKRLLDDTRDDLQVGQNWLFDHVQTRPPLMERFFRNSGEVKVLRESANNNDSLADRLIVCLVDNTIYKVHLNGLMVLITGYHKSEWRIGTHPITHCLSPAVG